MRLSRHFVDAALAVGQRVELPEPVFAHLVRVLRLGPGAACVLFNGDGADYDAVLAETGKRGASADVLARRERDVESPLRITLAQAVARGEKMDWILQKATELGVAGIAPVFSERTEVKLDGERGGKRQAHWRGVLYAACEQCGRTRIPELLEPATLAHYAAQEQATHRIFLDPLAEGRLSSLPVAAGDRIALAIGPEGGFSERDIATLSAAGFIGIGLGPRVLRTETAGLATMAALQGLYGDWR